MRLISIDTIPFVIIIGLYTLPVRFYILRQLDKALSCSAKQGSKLIS